MLAVNKESKQSWCKSLAFSCHVRIKHFSPTFPLITQENKMKYHNLSLSILHLENLTRHKIWFQAFGILGIKKKLFVWNLFICICWIQLQVRTKITYGIKKKLFVWKADNIYDLCGWKRGRENRGEKGRFQIILFSINFILFPSTLSLSPFNPNRPLLNSRNRKSKITMSSYILSYQIHWKYI